MQTEFLSDTEKGCACAAHLLQQAELVAFPTETVFGLGADARNSDACAAIFAAKERPRFNPLIVHVGDLTAAEALAVFTPEARALAQAFWPGPLTVVLPLRENHDLSPLVTAGGPTVALRVPRHPTAQALLAEFGGPLAAPSANPSGWISPTRTAHVKAGLGGKIKAILDGPPPTVGLESTIVTGTAPITVLRQGGIPVDDIETCLGKKLNLDVQPHVVTVPGQMRQHYAPKVPLIMNTKQVLAHAVTIGFGDMIADYNLSENADLLEAASNLFEVLHAAETLALARGAPQICVAPIPKEGLGQAINDRLSRAAVSA